MKPGHPLAFGVLERPDGTKSMVFGLPGNPVSSMVCFEEFAVPALRAGMGHARPHRRTVSARLSHPLKMRPGRTEFVRVLLGRDDKGYVATSTGTQSSGALLSMARADGLLVVPSDSNGLAAGETVTVQLLDGAAFQDATGYRE
jgi:molybdopterin molybdotransferase